MSPTWVNALMYLPINQWLVNNNYRSRLNVVNRKGTSCAQFGYKVNQNFNNSYHFSRFFFIGGAFSEKIFKGGVGIVGMVGIVGVVGNETAAKPCGLAAVMS
jgi:hypothetical protein